MRAMVRKSENDLSFSNRKRIERQKNFFEKCQKTILKIELSDASVKIKSPSSKTPLSSRYPQGNLSQEIIRRVAQPQGMFKGV